MSTFRVKVVCTTQQQANGMTKYRKGPQMTAKEHYTGLQRTAKEHYVLGCRKLAPIEINGALYSNAHQDSSKLAHSFQCLFCACLVVTSRWFALSVFVSYEMKITVVISIIVTTTYRLSTVKLGPTDVHSRVCNQQTAACTDSIFIYLSAALWNVVFLCMISNTHTHRLTALCPGLPGWVDTRKVKQIWILLKQETVSSSGISWPYASVHLAPDK